jgi:hypothetical protein
MRRTHAATAVLVALGTVFVLLGVYTADAQATPHSVVATTAAGVLLPADPALVPNERVVLVASGFANESRVLVRIPGPRDVPVQSDATGHARLVYTVPRLDPGSFSVIFVGAPAPTPSSAPSASGPSGSGSSASGGNVVVTVPLLDFFSFHVNPPKSSTSSSGSGIEGVHASRGPAPGGSGVSGLAGTGSDSTFLLAIGAATLAVGLGIEVLARRRRSDEVGEADERSAG